MEREGGRPAPGRSSSELAALYRRYGPVVYRRCLRILRHREEAEDTTQEVFVRLLRELPSLAGRATVLPWIYRVTTNACLNLRRDARRRGVAATPELELAATAPPHGGEARILASQLLARFDEDTRAVALHVLVGGLEHAEAAVRLELSPRGVARKLGRFRDVARVVLTED
jgi:RNA polymerase sigma-70 factor (ECF subfamily)